MGFVSATAADVVVTLPLAAAVRDGTLLVKKVFGAHTVRIVPQGADTIDGGVLVEIKELMAAFSLYSDGVTWHLI